MAIILNIDTSSKNCSVALTREGEVILGLESRDQMDHSTVLAPFVKECLDYIRKENLKLDAVSVIAGPGSYTGLRIGLSMAKGLAFSLEIPLLMISSLEVIAVGVMFSDFDWQGIETIVPMIDARRMEVFTCEFDSSLNYLIDEQPMILSDESFNNLFGHEKVIFAGDGCEKFKDLYKGKNGKWMSYVMPHAKYMGILSEKYFKKKVFADIAYSKPNYLKEYQTTVSKKHL